MGGYYDLPKEDIIAELLSLKRTSREAFEQRRRLEVAIGRALALHATGPRGGVCVCARCAVLRRPLAEGIRPETRGNDYGHPETNPDYEPPVYAEVKPVVYRRAVTDLGMRSFE